MRGLIRSQNNTTPYAELKALFKGDYYLAISRHLHPVEDLWIKPTLKLAKQYALPWLITQDVFFHQRAQKPMSDLLQAVRTNRVLDDCQAYLFPNSERCLHSAKSLARLYSPIPGYRHALWDCRRNSINPAYSILTNCITITRKK